MLVGQSWYCDNHRMGSVPSNVIPWGMFFLYFGSRLGMLGKFWLVKRDATCVDEFIWIFASCHLSFITTRENYVSNTKTLMSAFQRFIFMTYDSSQKNATELCVKCLYIGVPLSVHQNPGSTVGLTQVQPFPLDLSTQSCMINHDLLRLCLSQQSSHVSRSA